MRAVSLFRSLFEGLPSSFSQRPKALGSTPNLWASSFWVRPRRRRVATRQVAAGRHKLGRRLRVIGVVHREAVASFRSFLVSAVGSRRQIPLRPSPETAVLVRFTLGCTNQAQPAYSPSPSSDLQPIYRRELVVLKLDMSVRDMHVHLGNFQSGVTEYQLQGHHVPAIHQITHSEGVTE